MDTERAGRILEAHGLTKKAFADMIGLKASTARMAFSTKRFSKKMVAKLEELERESSDLAEVDEMLESVREPSVLEGMVRECTDNPLEREGKIYAVPRNKFLRLIEFTDGSHGKFRCKPNDHLKLGERLLVKHLDRDMWEVVR